MKLTPLLALFISLTPPVFAASFDCAKAGTTLEKMICDNPLLSKLDDALAKNYTDQVGNAQSARERTGFQQEQKVWIRERNSCADEACLVKLYSSRVDQLCPGGIKDDCIPSSMVLKQVDLSLRKPTPVKSATSSNATAPSQAQPIPTKTPQETAASKPTSPNAQLKLEANKALLQNAEKIRGLGFTKSELTSMVFIQKDLMNQASADLNLEQILGLLIRSPLVTSIKMIAYRNTKGVMFKRRGAKPGGVLFNISDREAHISHVVDDEENVIKIESVVELNTVSLGLMNTATDGLNLYLR